tara:strand:- start:408 stop:584 length:177 start_codon:yes stop_codon:yes gene_type:complete
LLNPKLFPDGIQISDLLSFKLNALSKINLNAEETTTFFFGFIEIPQGITIIIFMIDIL